MAEYNLRNSYGYEKEYGEFWKYGDPARVKWLRFLERESAVQGIISEIVEPTEDDPGAAVILDEAGIVEVMVGGKTFRTRSLFIDDEDFLLISTTGNFETGIPWGKIDAISLGTR
jgi:hypothetical protein